MQEPRSNVHMKARPLPGFFIAVILESGTVAVTSFVVPETRTVAAKDIALGYVYFTKTIYNSENNFTRFTGSLGHYLSLRARSNFFQLHIVKTISYIVISYLLPRFFYEVPCSTSLFKTIK